MSFNYLKVTRNLAYKGLCICIMSMIFVDQTTHFQYTSEMDFYRFKRILKTHTFSLAYNVY